MKDNHSQNSSVVKFFLEHKKTRTFIFQFTTCVFLVFTCLSISFLPPFEDHPHDINIYRLINVALVVYSIICFSGPICGANINPAVTLVSTITQQPQKRSFKLFITLVFAQIAGCFLGGALADSIYGVGGPIYEALPQTLDIIKDCVQQMIGTFLLLIFIQIITNEQTTFVFGQSWQHLMIGLIYYFCLTFSTHLRIINPAIVIALQLQGMAYHSTDSSGLLAALLVTISEFIGAILAYVVFNKIYLRQMKIWKQSFR